MMEHVSYVYVSLIANWLFMCTFCHITIYIHAIIIIIIIIIINTLQNCTDQ